MCEEDKGEYNGSKVGHHLEAQELIDYVDRHTTYYVKYISGCVINKEVLTPPPFHLKISLLNARQVSTTDFEDETTGMTTRRTSSRLSGGSVEASVMAGNGMRNGPKSINGRKRSSRENEVVISNIEADKKKRKVMVRILNHASQDQAHSRCHTGKEAT